jgi:hypothetical protein
MRRLTDKYLPLYLSQRIKKVCYMPLIIHLDLIYIILSHVLTYVTCENIYDTSIRKLVGKIQES